MVLGACALGLAALMGLGACGMKPAPSGSAPQRVRIVAGENFWGDIARQIGGNRAEVTSIISDPNTDPHLYESSAANASAVAGAKIVIVNGLGYDDFMDRLVAGSGAHPDIISAQKVLGVTAADANPHLWYDIPRVSLVAKAIEQALMRADPAGASAYAANLTRFDRSLDPLLSVIGQIKSKYPGAPIAYTERVPGYLVSAAGLTLVSPPGFALAIENGTDPSPADARTMDAVIATRRARVLLYNTQAVSAVTRRVLGEAKAAGVPVVGVSETMPPQFKTYQAWQLDQATQILHALGG
jgi:zinc/manganese transport system substrate-binding protein